MEIITKENAKLKGLKTYYTGELCKKGHLSGRYVSDGRCKDCLQEKNARYKELNPEKYKEIKNNWYKDNAEKEKARALIYYHNNKERARENFRKRYKKNPGKIKAKLAKRRFTKKNATPRWANLEKIKEIYENCPLGYQVDHIIPLVNDLVCGLHVEFNLQYLTVIENCSKGNNYVIE